MIRLLITVLFINSLIVSGIGAIPIAECIKSKKNWIYIACGVLFIILGVLGIYGAVTLKSNIY